MKFSMTGLEKDDYLIEVAALSGLTVYIYIYIYIYSTHSHIPISKITVSIFSAIVRSSTFLISPQKKCRWMLIYSESEW